MLLLLLLVALSSCQDVSRRENEELRQEITRVHDIAMAEIETMYELRSKLRGLPGSGAGQNMVETERCVAALLRADEAMFSWMRQYQPLAVAKDIEADSNYRIEQLARITEVGQDIDRAIETACNAISCGEATDRSQAIILLTDGLPNPPETADTALAYIVNPGLSLFRDLVQSLVHHEDGAGQAGR